MCQQRAQLTVGGGVLLMRLAQLDYATPLAAAAGALRLAASG